MAESKEIALYTVSDIETIASKMAPAFKMPESDLFTLMMIAKAEGIDPAHARQEYDIIKGRAAINSRSAQARFQKDGGKIKWIKSDEKICTASFFHPDGSDFTATWTIDRAKIAGLLGKDNWRQHPAAMLRARVLSEGIRACYPACMSGLYTVEEVRDTNEPRNVTPEPMTETPKAPEFKPQEPRNITPEVETVQQEIVQDIDEPEHTIIPALQNWNAAYEEYVGAGLVCEWAMAQDEETQKKVVDCFNFGDAEKLPEAGIIKAMFVHPKLADHKMQKTETKVIDHFNNEVFPRSDEAEITGFMHNAIKLWRMYQI